MLMKNLNNFKTQLTNSRVLFQNHSKKAFSGNFRPNTSGNTMSLGKMAIAGGGTAGLLYLMLRGRHMSH